MAELATMEFAVCVATFYEDLAERLVNGAIEAFDEEGVAPTSVHTFEVPGAFELPLAAKLCAEAASGIQRVQLDTGVPCAFGLITCDTREQAEARAGGDKRDQGRNAAIAVMRMAELRDSLS